MAKQQPVATLEGSQKTPEVPDSPVCSAEAPKLNLELSTSAEPAAATSGGSVDAFGNRVFDRVVASVAKRSGQALTAKSIESFFQVCVRECMYSISD